MMRGHKFELAIWIAGLLGAGTFFAFSHTFYVTSRTYACGVLLLSVTAFLFWARLRPQRVRRPKWLRITTNVILVFTSMLLLVYLLGIATWFE
jgi:hypothetical protein